MKPLVTATVSTCISCGLCRERVDRHSAPVIIEWIRSKGREPEDVIRGYSPARNGGFLWEHGGNYAVIDEDMLGGDGTGRTEDEFREATGTYFHSKGTAGRKYVCAECRRAGA